MEQRSENGDLLRFTSMRPLSKRPFLAALECPTKGWRAQNDPSDVPGPALRWRFHEGQQVQRLAREWLGPGRLLPSGTSRMALDATTTAVADPDTTLLFEATFMAEGCVARADAIRRTDGGWELIEVKAGSCKRDEPPKPEYIDDMSYTCAVLVAAGLPVRLATLVQVNSEHVAGSSEPLLAATDVTAHVLERSRLFTDHLADMAAMVAGPRPAPSLLYCCRHCGHFDIDCVGQGIDDPLFDLPGLRESRFDKLIQYGARISDLPPHADLTANQSRYVQALRTGTPHIDPAALDLLSGVKAPVCYLDFEAIAPAVPRFTGTRPYQKHPFQFSLHVDRGDESPLEHHQYLAIHDGDWRRDLADRLLGLLGDSGSVMVYSTFERQVLDQLAKWFPDLVGPIAAIVDRLFDLEKVVKGYLHPGFRGRTSIKKVLPVLDPGNGYDGMEVSGGEDAAALFGFMWVGETAAEEQARQRSHLLEYCKLDTLAMVTVHRRLEAVRQR